MHAQFRIDGQALMAMDSAEADFAFNEAVSLMVNCEDQAEIDRLWSALSAVPEAEACGWVKDRFGVSWQIVPRALWGMMASGDRPAWSGCSPRSWGMKKLDLAAIERAFAGSETVPRAQAPPTARHQRRKTCPKTSRSTPAPWPA